MSDSTGSGTPSFGDLFDDPDDPGDLAVSSAPPVAAPRTVVVASGPAVVDAPPEPAPVTPPHADEPVTAPDADDEAPADLPGSDDADDHESVEAAHLVAGFEHVDEPVAVAASAVVEPAAGGSVTVGPVAVEPMAVEPVAVEPVAVEPVAVAAAATAAAWDGTPDPGAAAAPAGRVDTGRLYRSAGAEGPATLDAIPAIDPSRPPRSVAAATAAEQPARSSAPRAGLPGAGLTYTGVVVIVTAATVVAGFLEALLRHQLGWLTGLALLVSSVYCALVVRRPDIWAAVVVPPLAFVITALTAGQLTLDQTGGLLIREGYGLFRNLAVNAPWILGTTAVCLVIVLVRRSRPQD